MSSPTRSELAYALQLVLDGGNKNAAQKVLDRYWICAKRCPIWPTSNARCVLRRNHHGLCEMP